ncbi:uncharacterized protein C1orf87 homolog [Spea bombifrons]|uniref:uncharacterized protein C1orf87 homolog n=1 Tax=Spea bombifrons TaxID=233779 RepID=UPI0023492CE1|nr:uncharacterized protein C1orf87 homolog [Spea bombifrons]
MPIARMKKVRTEKDPIPDVVVKIVGSKYVRYIADKSTCSLDENEADVDIIAQTSKEFSGLHGVESLTKSLVQKDQSGCGLLPSEKFQAVCGSYGVAISAALLKAILNDKNYSERGKIRWKAFIDLLKKVKNEDHVPGRRDSTDGGSETSEGPQIIQHDNLDEQPEERSFLTSRCLNPNVRPFSQPALHLGEDRNSDDREPWIDRFKKLENALQLCEIQNSGLVELERAKRLIHNYNLIYRLSLSAEKIEEALQKCHSGQGVLLEPALLYLKEL